MRWLRLIGWLRWEGLRGEKSENRSFFLFWVEKGVFTAKNAKERKNGGRKKKGLSHKKAQKRNECGAEESGEREGRASVNRER
jgi:hypothetical protein